MAATQANERRTRPWLRWLLWGLAILFGLLLLLVVGGYLFLRSGAGLSFVEEQVESREFPFVGSVELDGMDGNLFDALTIDEIKLVDAEGTWMVIRDLSVDYTLLSFRNRHIDIQTLRAGEVEALRRPVVPERESSGQPPYRTTVESYEAERIVLREPVLGVEAVLTASGTFVFDEDLSTDVRLEAERLDAPGESLLLDFARDADGDMLGEFDVAAPAGGPIATLMRAPDGADVTGEGRIDGTLDSGDGEIVLRFDERTVVDAALDYTPQAARVSGEIAVGAWPAFDAISARTGDVLDVEARLDRTTNAFGADLSAPEFQLEATGILPEEGGLPDGADIRLVSDTPTRLLPLPEGYRFGRVEATGRAGLDLSFQGDVALSAVATPYFNAGTVRAPVRLQRRDDGTFDISTTATLRELITRQALPIDLADRAVVRAVLRLNPEAQRASIQTFTLESGDQSLSATGRIGYGESLSLDVAGRADVRLDAIGAVPPGALAAEFEIDSVDGLALPAVSAEGAFRPIGEVAAPLGDLLGERLNFDVDMQPLDDGALRIEQALFASDALRAAVAGTVGDTLDIDGEASVLRTLDLGTAVVGEGSVASFTVTGERASPNLRLDATLPTLSAAGRDLSDVRLRADVSDLLGDPRGPVQIDADTEYGPLVASAQLASENGQYAATDIAVSLAGLEAGGDLRAVGDGLYEGTLALDLPRDGDRYASAVLALSPTPGGEQGVELDVDAENVSVAGYDIASVQANASGTLASLSGDLAVRGREDDLISQPFALDMPFTVTREDGVYRAVLDPEGEFEGAEFSAREPVVLSYGEGVIAGSADMAVNGGTLQVDYRREGEAETATARFADLPLQTFPLPPGIGETQAILRGELSLASGAGTPPTGAFEVDLVDWRGRLADPGEGITLTALGELEPGRLRLKLDDGGRTPFDIRGQARIPLTQADTLAGLRPRMDAPVTGRLEAGGDAGVLFALIAPENADPAGELSLDVALTGTLDTPRLSGTAGGTGIRFEAPVAGTRVRNARFAAQFTSNSVTISDIFANDGGEGTLEGEGRFSLEGGDLQGGIELRAVSFKALDRRDYEARVDGTVGYLAEGAAGKLTGDIKIDKAEVKQIVMGGPRVVTLQIDEEVGTRENEDRVRVPRQALPIELDMRVRAPRKIFIRARGIDLEAELDVRIQGTVSEPLLYGTAGVVRGGITLAGKEIEFEDDGAITFNGAIPQSTIDLEARAQTPTLLAVVKVTGTVEEPEIELSSQPERPDDEILSALLFGQSATQLSALEAAQLAGALAQLSGSGGGFDLVGGLRDAIGFSSLDIGVDDDGNALVSGGRYLARDVYLELFTGTDSSTSGAIISWEVRPNVVLRTKLAADNEQSFAVLYKKDF